MFRILKMIFCKHNFVFDHNVYGDQIMFPSFHRSEWRCTKCGLWQLREELVPEAEQKTK